MVAVRLTPEQLEKIECTGLDNKSEVIRRCIDQTLTERTKTSQNR
jgi:hypothetical protein